MTGVSTLSQLTTQLKRLEVLGNQFSDLQRSLTTGKKTTTYEGLGDDALSSLRQRTNLQVSKQYVTNIDIATTRIKTTTGTLELFEKQVSRLRTGISQQPVKGQTDIADIQAYSNKLLEVVSGVLNEDLDGRYLLAGNDAEVKPYEGNAQLKALVAQDVSDWMDGTITTAAFMARIEGYTDDEVGFSAEVLSAGNVTVMADDNQKLDYTAKASDPSIKTILVATEVISQLRLPTETDAPTNDQFHEVYLAMTKKLDQGAEGLESMVTRISATAITLDELKKAHQFDDETAMNIIEDVENVDTTETAVKITNIQLQLEASYRVTALTAQMNLLNYID